MRLAGIALLSTALVGCVPAWRQGGASFFTLPQDSVPVTVQPGEVRRLTLSAIHSDLAKRCAPFRFRAYSSNGITAALTNPVITPEEPNTLLVVVVPQQIPRGSYQLNLTGEGACGQTAEQTIEVLIRE